MSRQMIGVDDKETHCPVFDTCPLNGRALYK